MPYLHKITVYPIKSLDGVEVVSSTITEGGALYLDRAFTLRNSEGRVVNAKRFPTLQRVRAQYELKDMRVKFQLQKEVCSYNLEEDTAHIEAFFSDFLKEEVKLDKNLNTGFPDDDENSGPTLVSTQTLEEVQAWFPHLSIDNLRMRFRANLELTDYPEPFWEDRLLAHPGIHRKFGLGEVELIGKQPCARCAVPARDPFSGENDRGFMQKFINLRKKHFPPFANEAQFDHFYRLCVNSFIPGTETGKILKVGDTLLE